MSTLATPLTIAEQNRQASANIRTTRASARNSLSANAADREARTRRIIARNRQVEGARRVAAGQSGTGQGGTLRAIEAVEDYIAGIDLLLTDRNAATTETGLRLQAESAERAQRGQRRSVALGVVSGVTSDISTGLSLYRGFRDV